MRLLNEGSELYPLNAMLDRNVGLIAVNLTQNWVAFANGVALPITRRKDRFGYDTHELDEIAYIEFGDPSFGYGCVEVSANAGYAH